MSLGYKSETESGLSLRAPKLYAVILHNDDFTTMDFVVDVLVKVFHKSTQEAAEIMMVVHEKGSASAGVYTYDIAITRKNQTDLLANEKGFPLQLSICEAEA